MSIQPFFITCKNTRIKILEANNDESEGSSEPSGSSDQSEPGTPTQKSNSSKWKVIKTCLTEIYSVFITLFGMLLLFQHKNHFNHFSDIVSISWRLRIDSIIKRR